MTSAGAKEASCPELNLNGKKSRKPVRLTRYQAYSALFFTKGSSLHDEVTEAYQLYTEEDPATLAKYASFLPQDSPTPMVFVSFQQAIMRDKVLAASKEELAEVDEYIESRFEHESQLHRDPWYAMKQDDNDASPEDLEREYVAAYVPPFLDSHAF